MNKFYSLKNILSRGAQYNVIIGERSNGKTFSVLDYGVDEFFKNGSELAIVRRWQEDFTGKRGAVMFDSLVQNNVIKKHSNGEWSDVYYYGGKWFFSRFEKGQRITQPKPFAYGFSISSMEHDKSTAYPKIRNILFDEFLSRTMYLTDEFVLLMNVFSTIIRQRTDVKIFMLGNTVNKYCPYFREMGLTNIKSMKPGQIDVYKYGDSGLQVAVEYTAETKSKESNVYFAFNNPRLQMITGGKWEIDIYPHSPCKFRESDIKFSYFIDFSDSLLQCDIVYKEGKYFTFIHPKTTPIKNKEKQLIYTTDFSQNPFHRRNITKPFSNIEKKIAEFYKKDKIFYSDNETGEIVRNYLQWCLKN